MSLGHSSGIGSKAYKRGTSCDNFIARTKARTNLGAQPVGTTQCDFYSAIRVGMMLHVDEVDALRLRDGFGRYGQYAVAHTALKEYLCKTARYDAPLVIKLKDYGHKGIARTRCSAF